MAMDLVVIVCALVSIAAIMATIVTILDRIDPAGFIAAFRFFTTLVIGVACIVAIGSCAVAWFTPQHKPAERIETGNGR